MSCTCGFSTDYPNCNGTHNAIKALKDKIIQQVEAIPLESNGAQLNALGMRMLTIDIIKKTKGL